jgi:hypothetical protein
MIALTVTAQPSTYSALLTVTGQTGDVTIQALPDGSPPYEVRRRGDNPDATAPVVDYEVPFGRRVVYTATDSTGVATAVLDDAGVDVVVLSSTRYTDRLAVVTMTADTPHEWEARSAWFDVIGRVDPLVAVDVGRYRSGEWILYTSTTDERAALLALIIAGDPLLLRAPCRDVIDDAIVLVTRTREEPLVDNYGGRLWTLAYQAVTRALSPYAGLASWTYADLLLALADYTAVLDDYANYSTLLAGSPIPAPAPALPVASWSLVL